MTPTLPPPVTVGSGQSLQSLSLSFPFWKTRDKISMSYFTKGLRLSYSAALYKACWENGWKHAFQSRHRIRRSSVPEVHSFVPGPAGLCRRLSPHFPQHSTQFTLLSRGCSRHRAQLQVQIVQPDANWPLCLRAILTRPFSYSACKTERLESGYFESITPFSRGTTAQAPGHAGTAREKPWERVLGKPCLPVGPTRGG